MRKIFLAGLALPGLLGCDGLSGDSTDNPGVQLNTASITQIPLPKILRSVRSVDPTSFELRTRVNGIVTELARGENNAWEGVVDVPKNANALVTVEWGVDYGNPSTYLKLAEQTTQRFVGEDATEIEIGSNYNTNFDIDDDIRTNLSELGQNRSPVSPFDVTINTTGTFPTGGIRYPDSGQCGGQIPIAIVTDMPDAIDTDDQEDVVTDHEAWWCANLRTELIDADGNSVPINNLEVIVNVKDDNIFVDSGTNQFGTDHNDDSVEIYFDGNNNKTPTYDGQDDFQFRFAPLGDGVFTKQRGPRKDLINVSGKFTMIDGGYQLVAIFPLEEIGIQGNLPFGLNIEVNDDDDGESRDYKYSWIATEGRDISWQRPFAFGTSIVPTIQALTSVE